MGSGKPIIIRHESPGETRAVLISGEGRPCRIFVERWSGQGDPARWGSVHEAQLRAFSDEIHGAFVELHSGEEAVLRLKTRDGLTEGAALTVQVESERRKDKLARVSITERAPENGTGFALWLRQIPNGDGLSVEEDEDAVQATIDEALVPSVTLPNGGMLHVERTRALTAFDVDTAGRQPKGSAGARALSTNREAVREMARQVALRGLGGNMVLDCIGPLNQSARQKLVAEGVKALNDFDLSGAKVLAPSSLGLMQVSLPWRRCPLADRLAELAAETALLNLFRDVQREAGANPAAFYEVELSPDLWNAYLGRRHEADDALKAFFSGRVTVAKSPSQNSRISKR